MKQSKSLEAFASRITETILSDDIQPSQYQNRVVAANTRASNSDNAPPVLKNAVKFGATNPTDRQISSGHIASNHLSSNHISSSQSHQANHKSYTWWYVGFSAVLMVVGGLALITGNPFGPNTSSQQAIIKSAKNTNLTDEEAKLQLEAEIESIANTIIATKKWNMQSTDEFTGKWNKLDYPTAQRLKRTVWFQQFSFLTENKYNTLMSIADATGDVKEETLNPVRTLANSIGIAVKKSERLADLLEASKAVPTKPKLAQATLASSSSSATEPKIGDSSLQNTPENGITGPEIRQLLTEYTTAYQDGDIHKILTLFSVSNDNNDANSPTTQTLRTNFETVFSNSIDRTVNLQDIKWIYSGNNAIGSGNYNATVKLKNNKGVQTIAAELKMEIKLANKKLYIARFQLIEPSTSVAPLGNLANLVQNDNN